MSRPNVLILGGGFAGLACANALDARRFAVTLVDRKRHFEFLPNIHELLSGVKKPAQLRLSLNESMQHLGHRFISGDVTSIDPETHSITLGKRRLSADFLVIALGSADADYGVSGVQEHSMGFKSVAQCAAIHKRLRALEKRPKARIVVVGGGLEGVEALGELLRSYRDSALQVSIIEAQAGLLPGSPVAVGEHIKSYCELHSVTCINGDAVERITAKTVLLGSGRRLRSDLTIWTGGPAPPALLASSGLADSGCWVPVRKTLEHVAFANVFVVGDAADLPRPISKQAYHALDMGRHAAKCIERSAGDQSLRPFKASPKPTLIAFGDIDTILLSGKTAIAGPALAAGKEAVFSAVMTQLDQRALPERLGAALQRGSQASRRLLWPVIKQPESLRQQTQWVRLK